MFFTHRHAFSLMTGMAFALGAQAATPPTTPQSPPPRISLVVLDKHCAQVVQPYELNQNAATVVKSSVKRGLGAALDFVDKKLSGGTASSPDKNQLTEDARNEAKQLNWLPMSTEVMYGERAHEQMLPDVLARDSKLGLKLYAIADALLAEVTQPVEGQHEYKFQLFVLKNATHNAAARPGGFIYIDRGLIDDPKLALKARFALAHEVGHILQRHETKELQGLIVDSFTAKDEMQKAIVNAKSDPGALLENVKAGKDVYVRHQIDQELQADSCAARLLSDAYPERGELSRTITAFVKALPPYDAATQPAAAKSTPAAVPASNAASAPATKAASTPADASAQTAALVAGGIGALANIVKTPDSRHPNTLERTQNLEEIVKELTAPAAPRGA